MAIRKQAKVKDAPEPQPTAESVFNYVMQASTQQKDDKWEKFLLDLIDRLEEEVEIGRAMIAEDEAMTAFVAKGLTAALKRMRRIV